MSSWLANGFLKKYHGVEGGVLFRGKAAKALMEKYPALKNMNNALWAAPAWKWGLAIVPLYGAVTGYPPIEKVDMNNALALTGTGAIWAYYSMLVRPKSIGLFSVSVALVCSNGWNVYRRYVYDQAQKQAAAAAAGGNTASTAVVAVAK